MADHRARPRQGHSGRLRHAAAERGHLLQEGRLRGLHRPPEASGDASPLDADDKNLLERLFVEERRRLKIIPNGFGEKPVLSSCSARLCVRPSAGAACASLSSSYRRNRRRPKGPRRRIRGHPIRQGIPDTRFQQIRAFTRPTCPAPYPAGLPRSANAASLRRTIPRGIGEALTETRPNLMTRSLNRLWIGRRSMDEATGTV